MAIAYPLTVSKEAATDLSSSALYRHIKLDTDGKVKLCDSTADIPYGILQNEPITGAAASVAPIQGGGSSKVYLSGTLATGTLVTNDASGNAAVAASGQYTTGHLEQGGAVGEYGVIRLGNYIPLP